jgi:hypothetical protein
MNASWIIERVNGNSTRPQERTARTEITRVDTPEAARAEQRRLRAELPRGSADWYEVRAA